MKKNWLLLVAVIFFINSPKAEAKIGDFRFNPVMAALGLITVNVDFNLEKGWTLGPEVIYWNLTSTGLKYNGTGVGVRGNYYFSKKFDSDSWYLGASLTHLSLKISESILLFGNVESNASYLRGVALFGYHWAWETFNIHLGAGYGFASVNKFDLKDSAGVTQKTTDKNATLGLGAEFSIGWYF